MNPWDDDRKQPSWFHAPRDPSLLLLVLAIAFGFLTGMSCQNGDALLPVRTANTALVIGIEEAGRALRAQVTKNAQERMALCDSLPEPAKVDCRITAVEKAIEDGTPTEKKLKKITLLQWVIADAIQAYDNAQDADKEEAAQVLLSQLPLLVQAQHDVEELVKGGGL